MKSKILKSTIIVCINFYQAFLSFDKGLLKIFAPAGACRYPVSCSEYTKINIEEYGIWKGGYLGIKRIISCNPWTSYV